MDLGIQPVFSDPACNYPKKCIVRKIGKVNSMFITSALAGKELGIKELLNKIYEIYFRKFFLGYADMKDLKVYDIMKNNNELKL